VLCEIVKGEHENENRSLAFPSIRSMRTCYTDQSELIRPLKIIIVPFAWAELELSLFIMQFLVFYHKQVFLITLLKF